MAHKWVRHRKTLLTADILRQHALILRILRSLGSTAFCQALCCRALPTPGAPLQVSDASQLLVGWALVLGEITTLMHGEGLKSSRVSKDFHLLVSRLS